MKNTTIYWSNCPSQIHYDNEREYEFHGLMTLKPLSLLNVLGKRFVKDADNLNLYLKCPAAQNEYKNVFAIRAEYDFTFEFDKNKGVKITSPFKDPRSNPLWFKPDTLFGIRSVINPALTLNFSKVFFSEDNIEMSQLTAGFENNEFVNNTSIFGGRFNISSWFRPIDPTILLKKTNTPIKVKRGDILYYLRFHTDKKIKFKEFKSTSKIQTYMGACTNIKFFKEGLSFEGMYNMFRSKGFNKKIVKEINSNLV